MKLRFILFAGLTLLMAAACSKETIETPAATADGYAITATAIAPGAFIGSKASYTDNYSEAEEISDISGAWEAGDSFTALEINGETITEVKFTTEAGGANATFKASGAVAADENTNWVAVSGDVTVENGSFVCTYDGQDGTVANLGKYDYSVATATGASPVFNFDGDKRLTYVMRVILPAGIKYIEFNTGTAYKGGWSVSSTGKERGTTSSTEKEAVKMITLPSVSTDGKVAYIAVPAIDCMHSSDNRLAGIIVTIMSLDKKESQGKVTSANLSANAGCVGTYDMSKLALIPRPLASEAIRLGSVTYGATTYHLGSWAPFNLGGDTPTSDAAIIGNLYSWAETEPKTSFSKESWRWYKGGNYDSGRGYKYVCASEGVKPFIEVHYAGGKGLQSGPGTFYDIGGTKYDAARVKWGSEWRLPSNDISCNILKDTKYSLTPEIDTENKVVITDYAPGTYTNEEGYKSSSLGAVVIEANGKKLALYRCPYTDNGSKTADGTHGRYWTSTTDYGNIIYSPGTSNYWNRATLLRVDEGDNYVSNKSWIWDGLSIRAILNE
ncbi:MAG: hypothetical protein IJS62_07375 [Bacteroidales bacterium]|nr:hypothetical protein [Bacteroidales bacterium]